MPAFQIYVRISDNVLDQKDWGIRVLTIENGEVTCAVDRIIGPYGMSAVPTVGWTIKQIEEWSACDCTGNHPENFHDVAGDGRTLEWKTFVVILPDGKVVDRWEVVKG